MEPKPVRPPKAKMLQSSVAKDPVAFNCEYAGIRQGRWYCHDLNWERSIMHSAGIIPRLVLDHKGADIRRLVVKGPHGDCVVSHVDDESMGPVKRFRALRDNLLRPERSGGGPDRFIQAPPTKEATPYREGERDTAVRTERSLCEVRECH